MALDLGGIGAVALKAVADGVVPGLCVGVGQGGEVRFMAGFGQRQVEPEAVETTSS